MGIISQLLGQILVLSMKIYPLAAMDWQSFCLRCFIKLLLLPLSIKQYKSSLKMQEMQPLIQENSEKIQK